MYAENFLYFAGNASEKGIADGGSWCVPVSRVIGCDASAATTTNIRFKDVTPDNAYAHLDLTHANISADADIHKEIITRFHKVMSNPAKGKFITVADESAGVYAEEFTNSTGASIVTGCSILTVDA